jgi:chorismate dehydratase
LDYQSRTSVQLVRVLAQFYWKINPGWEDGKPGYIESSIEKTTAIVVIGDRVFETEKIFTYCYDMGEIWKTFTGFDFVFACWIANRPLDIDFISDFNKALAHGVLHLEEVICECEKIYPTYPLKEYFYENISFAFDDSKQKGLELFLKLTDELNLIANHSCVTS